jgi:hypothetical protein
MRAGALFVALILFAISPSFAQNGCEIDFQASQNFPTGNTPTSIISGDWNEDGNLDLVAVLSNSDNVALLLGNGSGDFANPVNFSVGDNPQVAISGDWNEDII